MGEVVDINEWRRKKTSKPVSGHRIDNDVCGKCRWHNKDPEIYMQYCVPALFPDEHPINMIVTFLDHSSCKNFKSKENKDEK